MFIERKITGRMHGEAERQFSSIIGWKALKESVELFGADSPATRLNTDLTGIDPDDYFSSIPYGTYFALGSMNSPMWISNSSHRKGIQFAVSHREGGWWAQSL